MSESWSYFDAARKAAVVPEASPACANTASRIVVYRPWWPNECWLAIPHNRRVRNLELPAKNATVPGVWFMSNGSRFGSPGPLVMSCSLRSVYAGTKTTSFIGLSLGCGRSSLVKSRLIDGTSPARMLVGGLYGPGSTKTHPLLVSGRLSIWQEAQPKARNFCSPFTTAARISGSLEIMRPGMGSPCFLLSGPWRERLEGAMHALHRVSDLGRKNISGFFMLRNAHDSSLAHKSARVDRSFLRRYNFCPQINTPIVPLDLGCLCYTHRFPFFHNTLDVAQSPIAAQFVRFLRTHECIC